jgi:hypothetical protein
MFNRPPGIKNLPLQIIEETPSLVHTEVEPEDLFGVGTNMALIVQSSS